MIKTPDQIYGELFEAVQMGEVFNHSKRFVDMIPLFSPEKILSKFQKEKKDADFDLKDFVLRNFKDQQFLSSDFITDTNQNLAIHIARLWKYLTREKSKKIDGSSSIPLPHAYIGTGRFWLE